MLDENTHALMLSLHKRLEALELRHSLGAPVRATRYSWPGMVSGRHLREKWMCHNWKALERDFEENRPRPIAGNPDERPIRVSLVDPFTEIRSSEYVGNEFHTFLDLAWQRAEQNRIRRQERVTEQKTVPDFKDSDPDGEWDNIMDLRKDKGTGNMVPRTRCLSDPFNRHAP